MASTSQRTKRKRSNTGVDTSASSAFDVSYAPQISIGHISDMQRSRRERLLAQPSNLDPVVYAHRFMLRTDHAAAVRTFSPSAVSASPLYEDHGDCDCICEFCGAAFWYAERLRSSPVSRRPRYTACCKSGQVVLNFPLDPPASIKSLFADRCFLNNVRRYNSMFSMTSFGAVVDTSLNRGSAPYIFKVSGQVSHWLGSLCPPPNEKPRFLQLYIYDTNNEVHNRLSTFSLGERNSLSADVIRVLIDTFDQYNSLVKLFRTAKDICSVPNTSEFAVRLYHGNQQHPYQLPSEHTLGAIVYDADSAARDFDIIIRTKDDIPQRVNNLHPLYMSMQYPLLFPYGEQGWTPNLRLNSGIPDTAKRMSMNMFYSYQIHDRPHLYTLLVNSGRLYQQYLVDAYICVERNRLEYIESNQNDFRSEFLNGIHDAICRGDTEGRTIGKRIFLPSSFTGGPRYMYKHYQDALAICRVHGNPQYFITFTCNVKWPEIQRHLRRAPNLTAQDRPDIIARVFEMKVHAFISFLKEKRPFGTVAADLYTIEFQKRGLPHCHTLLWVTEAYKIRAPHEVDNYISAEIPDEMQDPILYKVVTESMIHGPCGLLNTNAPCTKAGVCSKHFPKRHEPTTRFDENGYVQYKRSPGGPHVTKGRISVDNAYVVPYNKILCTHFQAHINVEYCGWNMVIKYMFKYISKGADRIRYTITRDVADDMPSTSNQGKEIDEIKNFVDGRFICPHEAAWRLLNFQIQHRNPAVQVLAVHLENRQNITFRDQTLLQEILRNQSARKTTLTEWLTKNSEDPSGRHLRYVDYLSEYRWDCATKAWIRRSSRRTPSIGRLVYIHPSSGELFYLRMLLGHQVGCSSFCDIRTTAGLVHPTYRAACQSLGLLGDDREWTNAFEEASAWANPSELRLLFSHMLLFCDVSDPLRLWNEQWRCMSEDFALNICRDTNIQSNCIPDTDLQQHILFEIEKHLNSNSASSSLANYGLPMPRTELLELLRNRLLMEERYYDRAALTIQTQRIRPTLHPEQSTIYETVMRSISTGQQILLFIYGHGGTGKTYLWTAIISALRSKGNIVLAVAASGIASLLLPSGRTAHSRFKIPIDVTVDSLCHIKKKTQLSQLLTETSLIVWDEAPMNDKRCFEALDRSMRDILDTPNLPYGGKSVLLGGDFRQTLPVKKKACKSTIIAASLPKSYIWPHFKVVRLTENMRLHRPNMTGDEKASIDSFSRWLLDIGDGAIGEPTTDSSPDAKMIRIPDPFLIQHNEHALLQLINFIYDDATLSSPCANGLSDKAIVCPKNQTTDEINTIVLNMAPGNINSYLSTDSLMPRANDRGDTELLYPMEYLNSLYFPGLPPHQLNLKINTPVMLLRNINQACGLCNGTRLLISQLLPKVIEAKIITGIAAGNRVYLPRITFVHDNKEIPFIFRRRQFPIKICYAMTINKSQG